MDGDFIMAQPLPFVKPQSNGHARFIFEQQTPYLVPVDYPPVEPTAALQLELGSGRRLKGNFIQIAISVVHCYDLSDGGYRVYSDLIGYSWQKDHCWPSLARLGKDLHKSERTVRRHLRELEELGLIRSEPCAGHQPNFYTVYWPKECFEEDQPDPEES